MQKARTLYFTSPKQLEVRETNLPELKADEVLVQTICSSISAGTEMLVYRGQFPQLKEVHDTVSNELKYPMSYGYACVGRIKKMGRDLDKSLENKLVFAFQPHASLFIAHPSSLIIVPASLSAETASLLPNMETAVNLVHDGAPILGERVLVLGQGIIGLLTASLLSEFPLETLTVVDQFELRRKALGNDGKGLEIKSLSPEDLRLSKLEPNDLTFELSGSPDALNDAIERTTFSGRIVIGSWYGRKDAHIDLGGSFHRSRIKLVSSQVSTISPELSGRWDKTRRFDIAWNALKRIHPEKWITHRFSLEDALQAYQLLDEHPQDTIQVIFDYSK